MNQDPPPSTPVPCPICSSPNGKTLWSVTHDEAARHFVSESGAPERFSKLSAQIKLLWGRNTCDVVRCDSCDFCYSSPYIAGDKDFYTLAFERDHYPKWKWEHQMSYDVLAQRRQPFRLLELGAGDGAFIKRITPALTPKDQVLSTEFSAYGSQQIRDHGVRCMCQDIRGFSATEPDTKFDAICLFQVLEHSDRLEELFAEFNALTTAGADLFIAVPSVEMVELSEANGGLLDMPPNHIGRWNKQCFTIMGARWSWEIVRHATCEMSFLDKTVFILYYRLLRASQKPGSWQDKLVRVQHNKLRKLALCLGMALMAPAAIPALLRVWRTKFGLSQWVHFRRVA